MVIFNPRITHINIYRTDNVNKLYRLVKSQPIDDTWSILSTDTGGATVYTRSILDEGSSGSSYEALNGIPETLKDTMVNYGISTQLNNELYVGQCSHDDVVGAENYIFRSKVGNYDQFDWMNDFLILPEYPKAIMAFRGRVYAFSSSNMYVINSNLMLEDTYEGIGCISQKSIIATDAGMCFCDDNNVFLFNGDYPNIISYVIEDTYQSEVDTDVYMPIVTYDTSRHSFVVITSSNSMWLYNVGSKRWDNWTTPGGGTIDDAIIGKKGEVLLADNTKKSIFRLAGDNANRKTWSWTSKRRSMGADTQDKFFKRTRITGLTSNVLDTVTTSKGDLAGAHVSDTDNAEYTYPVVTARKAKWIQYTITDESGEVDSIGTIYRKRTVR